MLNSNIVSKQHNLSNLKKKLITAETLQNSKLSVKEDLILRLNRGNLPIKFAPGSTRDIDYTLIEKYIANAKNGKSLPSVLKELNSKQEKLTLDFKNMSLPNSVYIKKYDDLSLQMKKINSECDSIRKTIQKIDDELQDVKSQRIETFNKFYEEVSMNLGTVYRELSGSKSGQAYLSLINTQEPYLEGVLFSCIVPGKHYTYMENLSGGEKSLAALSLIFAIAHAAKNGRKYPLFILDEVCAALDADNVRKLSKFITHHSHEYNTQFILISHKLEMYHNANVLFGLYKQDQSTELLSLDLESYKKEV
ncbi:MAG: Structural maintenance of chromosomes protein 1B [Marteilia pararefringens]